MIDIELKQQYNQLKGEVDKLYNHIEPKKVEAEIEELENKLQQKEIWENQELSQKISQELKEQKDLLGIFEGWRQNLADVSAVFELCGEDENDNGNDLLTEAQSTLNKISDELSNWKLEKTLSGEYDKNSAKKTLVN